eukprot:3938579-Rhodomonas_salina.3
MTTAHVATVASSSRSDSRAAWQPSTPSSSSAATRLLSAPSSPPPPCTARRAELSVTVEFDLGQNEIT